MKRRAAALLPVLGLLTLVALPIAWRLAAPAPIPAPSPSPTTIAPTISTSSLFAQASEGNASSNLEVALLRAGVSAQSLAAVGAPTQAIFGIVDAAREHFVAQSVTLASADAAYATAKRESDRLRRAIESGKSAPEDVAIFQLQSAALATATTRQESALNALFAAATVALTQSQRGLLRRIHEQRTWGLPMEFLVAERSEPAWVELRGALANERFAAQYGEEQDPAARTLLAITRADAQVAAARTGLDTNLTYLTASWNSALEP